MAAYPDPDDGRTDEAELFAAYLDYFRASVADKVAGLGEDDLHGSRVPSGWTPLGLVHHLAHMEHRWLQWGFLGLDVPEPWGDAAPDGGWLTPHASADDLLARLHEAGAATTRVLREHRLDAVAATGGRFHTDPPTLRRICFHVLQEYARHVGHLDVARELVDRTVGE